MKNASSVYVPPQGYRLLLQGEQATKGSLRLSAALEWLPYPGKARCQNGFEYLYAVPQRKEWKQPTPMMQYRAVVMQMEGNLALLEHKVITSLKFTMRQKDVRKQLEELEWFIMQPKQWNK